MATININAKCDLNKPVVVRHLDGMVFSQDVKANMIRVSVFRDREPVDLSGGSVSANIIRADGATVVQTGTIEGNVCSVVLPSSAYAVPGQIAIFVKHSTSAGPTTSTIAAITGYVYKSTTDTIVDPGSVVPNVNQLLAMIEDCEDATEACIAATAAAPVIDDTAGAGDTNKVWSASKTDELKNAIHYDVDNGVVDITKTVIWQNGYVNTSGKIVASTASGFALVPMSEGEKLIIGTANSNITIIGSTTAQSLSVGDTISIIQKTTSSGNYEEYYYTAEENINIVVCVKMSDYNLRFCKVSSALDEHGVSVIPDIIAGKYVNPSNGDVTINANYTTYVYPVYGLSKITVTPYITSQYMGYAFTDKAKATLGSYYGAYSSANENVLSVPSGAYYIYVTSNNATNTVKVSAKWCDLLEYKIDADTTKGRVSVLEQNSTINTLKTTAYSDMDTSQTGIIKTDGSIASYANCYLSDYISCVSGTDISYLIAYIYGSYVAVAFYDENKAHISGSDITAGSGTSGSFAKAEGTSTIPANAKYFRFTVSKKNTAASVTAGDQFVSYSYNEPIKEIVEDIVNNGSSTQWKNKRWCAFGTSITDTSYINQETGEVTGKYVPFLAQYSGLSVTNRGIAGGTIGSGGIHGGSSSILNAILNSNDLDTFDVITLEGFVNDFAAAVSIGEIGDTENTTMYGALHQALSYILANSHAEVVLITETTGQEYTLSGGTTVNYKILRKNSLNLYQQDYNDVIIRIGQFYGVHVIDAGGKSQINQYHPEYIIDQIHHTTLGGEQYAKTIWEELKNISPAKVSSN